MSATGDHRTLHWRVMYFGILLVFSAALLSCSSLTSAKAPEPTPTTIALDTGTIQVSVMNTAGESLQAQALVSVDAPPQVDDNDFDKLVVDTCNTGQYISAWASGYYISTQPCVTGTLQYSFTLSRIDTSNYTTSVWSDARACGACHSQPDQLNEYMEWINSDHAKVFTDRYFETMYLGNFLNGAGTSPMTSRDVINNDLTNRAPVVDLNYHGPGYKLDNPNSNGNCSFCHAPVAVAQAQLEVNPFDNMSIVQEGVTCDICHKVLNVELSDLGLPYENRPGVLSFEYLRPSDSPQFFMGPLAGHLAGFPFDPFLKTSCSPIFSKSEFCAACHYGKFFDTVVYGSYQEWKESDYSKSPESKSYRTCQDCHMSSSKDDPGQIVSSERQACSDRNLAYTNFDHNMMKFDVNTKTPKLIVDAATIGQNFVYDPSEKNWFSVVVKVESKGVGHRFPTDSPLRHLILVVEARDDRGTLLAHVNGDRIPNWAGVGAAPMNSGVENYGGQPGKIFANLLVEEDTNISPTAAYWNKTKYAWIGARDKDPYDYSDTRLLPGRADRSRYSFAVPESGNVTVTIKLVYRFAFVDLMWEKGWWDRPDIVVAKVICTGPPKDPLILDQGCNKVKLP